MNNSPVTTKDKKDRNAILMIVVICMIALAMVFSVFIYQQQAQTVGNVEIPDNPAGGVVPADGSQPEFDPDTPPQ